MAVVDRPSRGNPPHRAVAASDAYPPQVACPRCGWHSYQFGALLRMHRDWQKRSATVCANAAEVSGSCWSQWENGVKLPSEDSMTKIQQALYLTDEEREELAAAAGLRPLRTGRGYRPLSASPEG